ncbi:ParB N-terminal domain-containing protein [uncultured Roseibium sp.]|uniref:ParB N-terminal domain-containing protein n=1 Tax=uncultured Roseibium sp. TaxID=1936171 RepID=UPI00262BD865|nr:ParB N-terminal domain-containing protein [uncultured Roseibium sp.]
MNSWREIERLDLPKGVEFSPGSAPILQWIKIDLLVVDDSYQRPLERGNRTAIRKIAANFSWAMFSPVFVAPVEGGKYAIIDGQHRTHAAAACGIDQVPCQIVPMTLREQASAFAAVNGNVTRVTPWQIYKAALAAGEGWATNARDIAAAGGCILMTGNRSTKQKKPGEIYGIRMFCDVIAHHERGHIVEALRLLMRTEGFNDTQDFWNTGFFRPVVEALCARPDVFTIKDFEEGFAEMDLWTFEAEIAAANRERQREGHPSLAVFEQLFMRVLEWLEENYPEQRALPKPGEAA